MATVYLGIGTNIGKRREYIHKALLLLKESAVDVITQSSILETKPWGVTNQPDFLNCAVKAETGMTPLELLRTLKNIEKKMGRLFDHERWGPRVIDIDILLYDDLVMDTPELTIPHKLMHEREFVLRPLKEIAPDLMHPVLNISVTDLLQEPER